MGREQEVAENGEKVTMFELDLEERVGVYHSERGCGAEEHHGHG